MRIPGTPLVISYLRFSRLEQRAGDSIRRQLELSKRWADKRGLVIDDSYKDEGVSAFRGRNALQGALSRIIKLIDGGKIPKGSTLLVESLDRLSRSEIPEALQRFLAIVNSGVRIVTLTDEREYTKEKLDLPELITSIAVMSRANEESRTKGMRSAESWEQKRRDISDGKIFTRMLPGWLRAEGGKVVADREKAKIIKRIFALVLDGYGLGSITRMFNRDGVTPMGRGKRWHSTYVHSIIQSRAVIGEFVPFKANDEGARQPLDVVKGYYPQVVDETTYDAANEVLRQRRSRKYGGPTSKFINIFNGLLFDDQGEAYTVFEKKSKWQKDKGKPYRCLVSLGALLGKQQSQVNLRLAVFEAAFFDSLLARFGSGVLVKDGSDDSDAEYARLRTLVNATDAKIAEIQEQAVAEGSKVGGVVALLGRLERQRHEHEAKMKSLQGRRVTTNADRIRVAVERFGDLVRGELTEDGRMETRATLRQLVKRVTLRLERSDRNLIEGRCMVTPTVGDDFEFVLSYAPFTNSRNQSPLERATWQTLGEFSGRERKAPARKSKQ